MPMKPKLKCVVWDANIVIDAIQKDKDHYENIAPFLKEAETGRLLIVLSEITVSEITTLNDLGAQGVPVEDQARLIRDWLENPYIVRRNFDRGMTELAVKIGRLHGIKRAGDKAVLATAVFFEIPVVHTYDGKLLSLDGILPSGNASLRIVVPDYYKDTLFDNVEEGASQPESEARPEA